MIKRGSRVRVVEMDTVWKTDERRDGKLQIKRGPSKTATFEYGFDQI